MHVEWLYATNSGMGFIENPNQELMYSEEFNKEIERNKPFDTTFVNMLITFASFMRVMLSITVTETLGPIISTILYMFRDIKTFLIIWFIVIIMFTATGNWTFSEIPEMEDFYDSFNYWI